MRIGIDARAIYPNMDGIGRYGYNLIRTLSQMDPHSEYVIYKNQDYIGTITPQKNFQEKVLSVRRFSLLEQLMLPRILQADELDLFHSLHLSLPLFYSGMSLLTIHDIMPVLFAWFFSHLGPLRYGAHFYFKLIVRASIKKAVKIIVPSIYTKNDLVQHLGVKEDKIVVCHEAVDPHFHLIDKKYGWARLRRKYGLSSPFLLYVGNFRPYKNVERLLKAYAKWLSSFGGMDHNLVIVGEDRTRVSRIKTLVTNLGLRDKVVFLGFVSDEDLVVLMNCAEAFISPSIYEGFGLPVLEAMACGTPVITSNAASLPEVVGGAGITIDPYDVEGLTRAIQRVLTDEHLKQNMSEKGLQRAQSFSWIETAQKILVLYGELGQSQHENPSSE